MSEILAQCADLPEVQFAAGDVLLTEGTAGGTLYILVEGSVTVTKNGAEVAEVADPGAIFGEMSVLLETPISATVTASRDVRMRVADDPLAFLHRQPNMALHAARLLAARLQNATTYLADLKLQYEDRRDHFGMVDEILGAMVEQQPQTRTKRGKSDDPRL